MAGKRGVRATLIVEDQALERFTRHCLLRLGFARYELRVVPYAAGQGSAKQRVEQQYPGEVQSLRSRAFQQLALVVGTDADEQTVAQRRNRLAEVLQAAGQAARSDQERIVLWIPKWNVETWVLYFAGQPRDEEHDYKHEVHQPDFPASARLFVEEYHQYRQDNDLDTQASLRTAYDETQRLDP